MITEQELKDKCTPEFIKWMCEFAEGFSTYEYNHSLNRAIFDSIYHDVLDIRIFPLLIYRAVEGWNKKFLNENQIILYGNILSFSEGILTYNNYQPGTLTQAECAMLHCLLGIFSEQEERDDKRTMSELQ